MSELRSRVLSALIAVPVVALVVYAGGPALAILLAALGAAGTHELFAMARRSGLRPLAGLGIPLAAAIPLVVHVHRLGWIAQPLALGGVLVVALLGAILFARRPDEQPLGSMAVTLFGPLYLGGLLAFGYTLRHHPWIVSAAAGTALLGLPVVATWLSDIGAYALGRTLGRARLMALVSPGKTRAGAIGAVVCSALGVVAYDAWILRPVAQLTLSWPRAVALGIVLSMAGQVGDLVKSLLKREAGVKDSGRMLPGHGGVVDRLDSLLFALPVAHLLLGAWLAPGPLR
ncbi:MAG: phosphatidate cytidylyltransferase [Gemmatimonadaceae bacterium]